ncbi:unnamed protein product [Acanthosepion pharaonis]|uniref:Uncharacterized protein n=1 Tax=Acanthosepion pharaonis TaxID=158019 RepID=A0A812E6L3_ACAPH|nr:unnamed protein product [Sepia pharaonis]
MKYFWTSSGRDLVICFQHGVLTATHKQGINLYSCCCTYLLISLPSLYLSLPHSLPLSLSLSLSLSLFLSLIHSSFFSPDTDSFSFSQLSSSHLRTYNFLLSRMFLCFITEVFFAFSVSLLSRFLLFSCFFLSFYYSLCPFLRLFFFLTFSFQTLSFIASVKKSS